VHPVASILRSGINGNSIFETVTRRPNLVASILRSGINGNLTSTTVDSTGLNRVASILRSGINGNHIPVDPTAFQSYIVKLLLFLEVELMTTL
jgi:hypothetical protein